MGFKAEEKIVTRTLKQLSLHMYISISLALFPIQPLYLINPSTICSNKGTCLKCSLLTKPSIASAGLVKVLNFLTKPAEAARA